ncbi:TetR/AcrR family transcriptional regulator [Prauserella cavernicola]|uniref:TetR/AcrR family transcriptional regulator n=1 Tax=Prauserella cavernicola TaxID=2800127 RepID=A0A934V783_9PSEU|nr:TetR family transcriptional regulator [Prauserella cavernicola]MBK1786478.1 TetR/AcrR family transcriptional regulator [Prauserella cavernicola]
MTDGADDPGDGRSARWREHREARRAQFVDAAFRALDRLGPSAGMADIAREAGVAKPRLYSHFADKAALHDAVSRRTFALVRDRLAPALSGPAPIRERVSESVRAYLGVLGEHPNVFRFVCAARAGRQASEERTAAAGPVAAMLGEYLRAFGVESEGASPWAHGIVGAVEAAGNWWLDHPELPEEQLADYLTTLVAGAIEAALRSEGVALGPDEPVDLHRKDTHGSHP